MLSRRTWLVVLAVCSAWPTAVLACSCRLEWAPPWVGLRKARDEATVVYRARVVSEGPAVHSPRDSTLSGPRATRRASVEVLEVFKGEVKPGDLLNLPSGGGSDCTIAFEPGTEYLLYSRGDRPDDVDRCSRTQRVAEASLELDWLRTGMPPPRPVALQRASVSCEPCNVWHVGRSLVTVPSGDQWPEYWDWQKEAQEALKTGHPFAIFSDSASVRGSDRVIGISWDGRPFELKNSSTLEACTRAIQLHWCKRLEVGKPQPTGTSPLQCIEPGETTPVCDENTSRKVSWRPLEEAPPAQECGWFSLDAPMCELEDTVHPLETPAALSPVLMCIPGVGPDDRPHRSYVCHPEKTSRSVTRHP